MIYAHVRSTGPTRKECVIPANNADVVTHLLIVTRKGEKLDTRLDADLSMPHSYLKIRIIQMLQRTKRSVEY